MVEQQVPHEDFEFSGEPLQ